VAAGEGIAGDGDAEGESSFSEEGACINESKESLAALGDGFDVGAGVAAAGAFGGAGLGLRGVASMRADGDFGRCSGVTSMGAEDGFGLGLKMLIHPLFFGFSGSIVACAVAPEAFSSNLPFTIVPETRLETL